MSALHTFVRLNNPPLYGLVLLIHSSVDGDLGCCHLLATVNITAINGIVQYLFKFLPSMVLGIYPAMELSDHMVMLVLVFSGTTLLLSIEAKLFYVPTKSFQAFGYRKALGRGRGDLHTSGEDMCGSIKVVQGFNQISIYTLLNFR